MDPVVAQLIERFGLERLPVEGTYVARTYVGRSGPDGVPAGTAILGLYCSDPPSRSLFHRLSRDEVWHFHAGDPLRLVLLHPDGRDEEVVLGPDVAGGQAAQHVVPAGSWQAGELVSGGRWALFGCTMAPGFTAGCFEGGATAALLASHPARRDDIDRLGVPAGEALALPEEAASG